MILISKTLSRNAVKTKDEQRIQRGKITYSDLNKPAKPFFSKKYRIAGKPDYIVQRNGRFIPVELKTGSRNEPQRNHVFQLASYCQLLEENYGAFVPYGVLVYNNMYQYRIPFDPGTRFELESTVRAMRQNLRTGNIIRNHNEVSRCIHCSMREHCPSKIK